jgi:hypothetical protein
MNDELERIWKKALVTYQGIIPVIEYYLVCLVLVYLERWDREINFKRTHEQLCSTSYILIAKFLVTE